MIPTEYAEGVCLTCQEVFFEKKPAMAHARIHLHAVEMVGNQRRKAALFGKPSPAGEKE